MRDRISPRSAVAFKLRQGQFLSVIDVEGQQVSDMLAFNLHDRLEYLSSGRTIDYASRLFLSTDDILYSNRSQPMLRIVADEVGRHDFTLTPCSRDTFRIIYGDKDPAPGCQGNFERVLEPYGIGGDAIPVAFNIFMNVEIDGGTGEIAVRPPRSQPGERIIFEALMDLLVALTACSAGQSNNFRYKPIDYAVSEKIPA